MALGVAQTGQGNYLYKYMEEVRPETDFSYAVRMEKLVANLESTFEEAKGGTAEGAGEADSQEEEAVEEYGNRKKEWEEVLSKEKIVEAMLRQMLEHGLGQQKEEQQNLPRRQKEEELDNEFHRTGMAALVEGKTENSAQAVEQKGNSGYLQTDAGHGAEYQNLANGARTYYVSVRVFCLTCETECDRKKQWKIKK